MARSVNLGDDVDAALEGRRVNNTGKREKRKVDLDLIGKIYNICNLGWCVGFFK